jgi:hypothetical protein
MARSTQGWRTFVKPRDKVTGVESLHVNSRGVVNLWQRAGDHYRLTQIRPDGSVRQANGRTKNGTLANLES